MSATLLAAGVITAVVSTPAAASASIPVVTATDVSQGTGACTNGNTNGGTTDVVNCNLYPDKASVWLAATGNHSTIPQGTYFFVVLAPSGQNNDPADSLSNTANLSFPPPSSDPYTNRTFSVDAHGNISYSGTHGFDQAENKIQLLPYNDTPNSGGEYVLELCALAPGQTSASVSSSDCNSDNFKVAPSAPAPAPQLSALKSSSPASGSQVSLGQTVTYTVTLTNTGNAAATNVTVSDAVPTGTTYSPSTAACTGTTCTPSYDSTTKTVSWTGITVPAESGSTPGTASVSFQVTVDQTDANNQVLTNVAAFTNDNTASCVPAATTGMCLTNPVTLTVNVPPPPAPQLSAVKSSNPVSGSNVSPDATVTYTVTLKNTGNAAATNVTVSDAVPTGTTYVSGSAGCTGTTCTVADSSSPITWSGITVPAESGSTPGTASVSFRVTVDHADTDGQVINNTATFTNENSPNCSGATCSTNTVTLTVSVTPPTPAPQLSALKSSSPASGSQVSLGQTVTYTVTLTNTGNADATGVAVSDLVPTGTTYSANSALCTGAGAGCTPSYDSTTKTVSWSGITVPAESGSTPGTASVSFQVTVDQADTNAQVIDNTATFTNENTPSCSGDTCATNTVTVTVNVPPTPLPELSALKSSSPASGSTVSLGQTVTYTVTLTNTGNADATDVTVSDALPPGTTYVAGSAACAGTTCTVNDSSSPITWSGITVPAESGSTPGTASVSFKVTVDQTDTDGEVIPNTAMFTDENTPNCQSPLLEGALLDSPQIPQDGPPACTTNTVTLTVSIPHTPPPPPNTLPPVITTTPPSTTTAPNVTTPTPGAPQLTVTKSSDPATGSTVHVGDTVIYTLALANAGTADATNVTVTDAVPTGTSYVSGSASCNGLSGCSVKVSGGTITWSGITVPAATGNTTPGTASVTFEVAIAQGDTNNETVSNVATYSNEGTPSCSASTCSTNQVTLTVSVPQTAPAQGGTSTPPAPAPKPVVSPKPVTKPAPAPKPVVSPKPVTKPAPAPAPAPKPVVSPKPVVVPGATTVHTGEPWAGSKPLEVLVLLAGSFAAGLGEVLRRRSRRLARR